MSMAILKELKGQRMLTSGDFISCVIMHSLIQFIHKDRERIANPDVPN